MRQISKEISASQFALIGRCSTIYIKTVIRLHIILVMSASVPLLEIEIYLNAFQSS